MTEPVDPMPDDLDSFLPHNMRNECRELILNSFEATIKNMSKDQYMETAKLLGQKASGSEPVSSDLYETALKNIDFELDNYWELPVEPERWEPFWPLYQKIEEDLEGVENKEHGWLVLMQIFALGIVAKFKLFEDSYLVHNAMSYEQYMAESEPWIKVIQRMNHLAKYREQIGKHFATRHAQFNSGKQSSQRREESRIELLDAALEEAKVLMEAGKASTPSAAARDIVLNWRSKPHTKLWFEREDGSQIYADPEQAIRNHIAKANLFPKRGRGRPKKNS